MKIRKIIADKAKSTVKTYKNMYGYFMAYDNKFMLILRLFGGSLLRGATFWVTYFTFMGLFHDMANLHVDKNIDLALFAGDIYTTQLLLLRVLIPINLLRELYFKYASN